MMLKELCEHIAGARDKSVVAIVAVDRLDQRRDKAHERSLQTYLRVRYRRHWDAVLAVASGAMLRSRTYSACPAQMPHR